MILPKSHTKKSNFQKKIKEANICIATTGLHHSTGWKFGEYVTASRAIITEPLYYEVLGKFTENNNYLVFNNENELINNIKKLLKNKHATQNMMNKNHSYYNKYLKPDQLILNTLKIIESYL